MPIPYSFNYVSEGEDGGKSSHQESSDGAGKVTGSYSLTNTEGHTRVVEYIADENGFRAVVKSNEPGTLNQNPADVTVESTAEASPMMNSVAVVPKAEKTGVRYVLVPVTDPRAEGYY